MKWENAGVCGEEERNADYGGMAQPSQKYFAPFVKGVEWGLETRGLIIVTAYWAGIPRFLQPRLKKRFLDLPNRRTRQL